MGRRSLTWAAARMATSFLNCLALAALTNTTAAAPSVISEQSDKRSGGAISGFLSETVLQASKLISRCMCARGLASALWWFLEAMAAMAGKGS